MEIKSITNFTLVHGPIPSTLENGKLYVNPSKTRAHHLCACGCGYRVLTPLNDHEWMLSGSEMKPSLAPSIGNWNLRCQSHYWIKNGKIVWGAQWSSEEIAAGRAKEQKPYMKSNWYEKMDEWKSKLITFVSKLFE